MGEPQFAFATFRGDLRHVFGRQRERAAPALQLHETKGADAEAHRKKRDAGEPQRGKPERNHARIKRETGVDGCGQRGGRSGVAERLQRNLLRRGGKQDADRRRNDERQNRQQNERRKCARVSRVARAGALLHSGEKGQRHDRQRADQHLAGKEQRTQSEECVHRPSLRALSISRARRSRSSRAMLTSRRVSMAATACSTESSKNVFRSESRARRPMRSRATRGA